jgi:hypothetical protein
VFVSEQKFEDIKPHFRRMVTDWRKKAPWIQGVGIGRKLVRGEPVGEDALTFFVGEKVNDHRLDPSERIPETIHIPGTHIELPTDVVAGPKFRFAGGAPRAHGGDAIAPLGSYDTGTIGAVLKRRSDGQRFLLSAAHTLVGIGGTLPIGHRICHPPGSDVIGRVSETVTWSVDPTLMPADVGLAEVIVDDDVEAGIAGIASVTGTDMPVARDAVIFSGAVGFKRATVAWDHRMILFVQDVYGFDNTFLLGGVPADFGDSGALVVNAGSRLIGIVFATNGILSACSSVVGINRVIDLSKYDF